MEIGDTIIVYEDISAPLDYVLVLIPWKDGLAPVQLITLDLEDPWLLFQECEWYSTGDFEGIQGRPLYSCKYLGDDEFQTTWLTKDGIKEEVYGSS